MKKMTVGEVVVHVAIWLLAIAGLFYFWNFSGDWRRVMVAPGISATVSGLAALAVAVLIFFDLYRNEKRFKLFAIEVLLALETRHQAALRRVARGKQARRKFERRKAFVRELD